REVALTGSFTEADRTVVRVLSEGQTSFTSDGDRQRSLASELFQVTAVNVHWAHHDLTDNQGHVIGHAGQVRYEQHTPGTHADGSPDSGERLMDYSHTPPGPPSEIQQPGSDPPQSIDQPMLTAGNVSDISNRITGRSEQDIALANAASHLDHTVTFHNEAEMESTLARLRSEGRLPMVMEVNAANEPFWSDSGGGTAGGAGSWHVVTITDYDPATHRVSIDNQWGEQHDRSGDTAVSAHDLYLSTLRQDTGEVVADLQARVDRTHDAGTTLDLVRQQRAGEVIGNAQFDRRMSDVLNTSHADMMRQWTPDARAAHHDVEVRFARIFAGLPQEEQVAIAQRLDGETRQSLISTVEQIQHQPPQTGRDTTAHARTTAH